LGQAQISFELGDGVVLYTDGVTEARNSAGNMYGLECLKTSVAQHWHKANSIHIQKAVIADLQNYMGDAVITDDITLVVLRRI